MCSFGGWGRPLRRHALGFDVRDLANKPAMWQRAGDRGHGHSKHAGVRKSLVSSGDWPKCRSTVGHRSSKPQRPWEQAVPVKLQRGLKPRKTGGLHSRCPFALQAAFPRPGTVVGVRASLKRPGHRGSAAVLPLIPHPHGRIKNAQLAGLPRRVK